MHLTQHIVLGLAFITSAVVAAPNGAAKTTTCNPTTTAKFDSLPTGSAPPGGYGHVIWNNLFVTKASTTNLTAPSKPNFALSPPQHGPAPYIAQPDGTENMFELVSFWYACANATTGALVSCVLGVDAELNTTYPDGTPKYQYYGNYNYNAPTSKATGPLKQVVLPKGALGWTWDFVLPDADGNNLPNLYLDSLVIVNPHAC